MDDLVYKFKKNRGMTGFSDQFRKIIMRYKRIGYNLNLMRQSACLDIYPITVDGSMIRGERLSKSLKKLISSLIFTYFV